MTEEQANDLATQLTIALLQEKKLPGAASVARLTPAQIAQGIVPPLLAIRDALLMNPPAPDQT